MRNFTATVLAVAALVACTPAWAGYGLSNVVEKTIDRQNTAPLSPEAPPQGTTDPSQAAPSKPLQETPGKIPQEDARGAAKATAGFAKTVFFPYTIHASSWQSKKDALDHCSRLARQQQDVFVTKIDLGVRGIWYRVDVGVFANVQEATQRMNDLKAQGVIDPESFIGSPVPLAVELGVFSDRARAVSESDRLRSKGIVTYIIKEKDTVYRLLAGAYPDHTSAQPFLDDLASLGIPAKLAKR